MRNSGRARAMNLSIVARLLLHNTLYYIDTAINKKQISLPTSSQKISTI